MHPREPNTQFRCPMSCSVLCAGSSISTGSHASATSKVHKLKVFRGKLFCCSTMATSVFVLRAAIWCSVLVSACCVVVEGRRPAVLAGCRGGHGSCLKSTNASTSHINESIKMTPGTASGREANGRLRPSEPEAVAGGVDSRAVRPELRWAPSGPDPLHHNGGSPKKPQTP